MSRRTLPVLLALVMIGTAHSTALAQAAQPSDQSSNGATTSSDIQNFPVDYYAYNECQGEKIHLTGTEHVVRHVVRDGNSSKSVYHLSYSNTKAVGVKTGLTYVVAAGEQEVSFVEAGVSSSNDFVLHERINGLGSTPDLGWHMVQNASWDGSNYTVTTKSNELTCR